MLKVKLNKQNPLPKTKLKVQVREKWG